MNQYSHAVLAKELIPLVQPENPAEYLWGAVAPDIRYLTGMRREHTHRPDDEIAAWAGKYPDCQSFIQGYRIHCVLDKIDTAWALTGSFPIRLLRPILLMRLSARQAAVAIELYYQREKPDGIPLTGGHNPVLESLGITPGQSNEFFTAIKSYLESPSYQTAVEAFTRLGIIQDGRLEKYAAEYQALQKNTMLLGFLMGLVRNAGLEGIAYDMVLKTPSLSFQ